MKESVYLKSVLRQPVRGAILVLLIAVATFAFVARATEYIVINNEINRIEGFFRSIGMLSPIDPENFTTDRDVTAAAEIVADSPYAAFDDRRVFTRGILEEITNTSSNLTRNFFVPTLEGIDANAVEIYVFATMSDFQPRRFGADGWGFVIFEMYIDELIAGDPSTLRLDRIREIEVTMSWQHTMTLNIPTSMLVYLPYTPGALDIFEDMESGQQFLMRAIMDSRVGGRGGYQWYLRPLTGNDGMRRMRMPGSAMFYDIMIDPALADDNLVYFVNTDDEESLAAVMAQIQPDIDMLKNNIYAQFVIGTKDMGAMPRMQTNESMLWRGRWIDHYDHINANPVTVIHQNLALRRGLEIGDTITLTLQDMSRPSWIDRDTTSRWSPGTEGWWDSVAMPWWIITDAEARDWQDYESHTLELEIVGTFFINPAIGNVHNFHPLEMYIPASLMPEGFGWDNSPLLTGMYSFVLDSPRHEAAFYAENREALYDLGFEVSFMETGVANFWASADPIRQSILINLVIFSIVSVLILALAAFLYIRQNRRNFAISRALGTPVNKAIGRMFVPVLLTWLPAVIIGSIAAWFFALGQATANLQAFADVRTVREGLAYELLRIRDTGGAAHAAQITIDADILWLLVLTIIVAAATFAAVLIGSRGLARHPVLELLQGVAAKTSKPAKVADPGESPAEFTLSDVNFSCENMKKSRKNIFFSAGRFIINHTMRSPARFLLAAGLAMFFMISLAWLDDTIAFTETEINRLYDTTIVTADILRSHTDDRFISYGGMVMGGRLTHETLNTLMASSFVADAYLESGWPWTFLSPPAADGTFPRELWADAKTSADWYIGSDWIFATNNLPALIYDNIRKAVDDQIGTLGSDIEITFAPGFDEGDFVFVQGQPTPVIIRKALLDQHNLQLGDLAFLTFNASPVHIIGVFDGGLDRSINQFGERNLILMPLEALHSMLYAIEANIIYMTARLYIDPTRNRDLEDFVQMAQMPLSQNTPQLVVGRTPMTMILHDEILTRVVEPMEQSLVLLRILYPIATGVSFILAIGLSLLLMLQNAKNAAIMRVLGEPKIKVQTVFCIEQALMTMSGIALGLAALIPIGIGFASAPFMLAGLYLFGAVIGSIIGALSISGRTPLELLQVRE